MTTIYIHRQNHRNRIPNIDHNLIDNSTNKRHTVNHFGDSYTTISRKDNTEHVDKNSVDHQTLNTMFSVSHKMHH